MKMKLTFLIALLIFVAGSATDLRSTEGHYNQHFVGRSFVVTFSRYHRSTPTQSQTMIQLVNSRRQSLIRRIGRDGRDIEHFLPAFAPGSWEAWSDRAAYLRSAHVTRTEQIVGLTAYVFRQDIGGQMLERWYAPETGPIPLKEILQIENGDALITEATSLEFREISAEELEPQASLVVNSPQ